MKATTGHGARGGFRRAALTVLAAALAACLALTAASCSSDSDDDDDSGKITWTADRVYENTDWGLTVTAKSDGTCTAVMSGEDGDETYNGTFTGNLAAGTEGTISIPDLEAVLSYTVGSDGKSLTVTLPASITQGAEQQVTLTLKDSGSSSGDGDGEVVYDTVKLTVQEVVSGWETQTSKAVQITKDGTYELTLSATAFTASYFNSADEKNNTEGKMDLFDSKSTQSNHEAVNLYVKSADTSDTAWTSADGVQLAVKMYVKKVDETDWSEVTLTDGYATALSEDSGDIYTDISLVNPWDDDYVSADDWKDVWLTDIKIELTVSGIE